ncbi:hypothetical protein ACFQ0I_17060 [Mariniflexile aquimaris]|uniref:Outer membrane protein beta-barrel domain-containing protein n=1 Tax=Mariniflexile aquimaris TaxID=881009 RepID=A0ABW3BWU5_9FLAO
MGITPDYKNEKRIKIEKGIFIGASMTSLKFDDHKLLPYLNSKYKSSTDISFGVYLELFLNKNKGWSLYNEIQYYSYKSSNHYEDIENENIFTTINTKISHSFIKLNNLARFGFSMANQPLYFNLGMTNGWVITEENYRRIESNVFSVQTVSNGLAIPDVKNHEFGIIMGLGTKFNKLSFEVRYEITDGVSEDSANSKLNKLYFLVGYRL